jgi:cell division protease FtsH
MRRPRLPRFFAGLGRRTTPRILVLCLALVAGFLLFASPWPAAPAPEQISLTELADLVRQGKVRAITVSPDEFVVDQTGSPATLRVIRGPKTDLYAMLNSANVPRDRIDAITVRYAAPPAYGFLGSLALLLLPVLVLIGITLWIMSRARGPTGEAFSFGRSRARRVVGTQTGITFADVAGVDEAKEELQEVVEFLRTPEKFAALGARTPRGILLLGPPGTGKTLIAKAVAGEAGVPFFAVSGSEFVEMFVGVGASRARDLFDQAKKAAPCIVFVDEIDAVGRSRGIGMGGGNDEREQTLNQILVEMDGFDTNTNVIVVAATNRPDVLDPALLRPGRFDRQVHLDRPDIVGRTAVLNVHRKGKPLDADVEIADVARQTAGFSGADLANLLNEAAILAARRDRKTIGTAELEEAVDRVVSGPARINRVVSAHEKSIVAYHESGHAVVAKYLPHLPPLHKVTAVPRGTMGGYTRLLPTEDRYLRGRRELEETLVFTMGGRVAEEMVFAEQSTGAANDIEQATHLAREMVVRLGMSKRFGPIALGEPAAMGFLGRGMPSGGLHAGATVEAIDDEVRWLLDTAAARAERILGEHRDALDRLAAALIDHETVAGAELEGVFAPVGGPA